MGKTMFANVVVLLVTVTVAGAGSAGIDEDIDAAHWPQAEGNATENRYVPNEIIVKYSKAAADKRPSCGKAKKRASCGYPIRLTNWAENTSSKR